jgi:TPR repeat protein
MKALIILLIIIGQLSSIQISQAQGFYAVSRPTIMLPARGVFFGAVLARPQAATGMATQTFVQQKQKVQSNTQLAQKHSKAVSRIQILQQIEGLWNQVRRDQTQAMYQLAKIYEKGNHLPPQPAMSRRLLLMAARKGHQQAAVDLRKLASIHAKKVSGKVEK